MKLQKILCLNWRDTANPKGGGAEKYGENILSELVNRGYQVDLFTAEFPGCLVQENRSGINVIRKGGTLGVYREALRYLKEKGSEYDLIIDEINTIPFQTWRFPELENKRMVLIYQLARNVWFHETPFPVSLAGYLVEPFLIRPYRHTRCVITDSQSTRQDLCDLGFSQEKVHVIDPPCDYQVVPDLAKVKKSADLEIVYLGRLKNSKRVHHIVRAAKILQSDFPKMKLNIVGSGDQSYLHYLHRLAGQLGLEQNIEFHGFVDDEKKAHILRSSHFILMASVREGWGLVVNEANAQGTPAVVYNVHGLRDSTRHLETGWICDINRPEDLARGVRELFLDSKRYREIQKKAWEYARSLTIQTSTDQFEKIITRVYS